MNKLQNFFEDGIYIQKINTLPTGVYPNGRTSTSTLTISSIYEDFSNSNTLLVKKINIKSNDNQVNINYNVNGKIILTSTKGSSNHGSYKIKDNKLINNRIGFSYTLGKNVYIKCKIKKIIINNSVTYEGKTYYKENKKWIYYSNFSNTKI